MVENYFSGVPWGMEPSLKDKAQEVGIDFDTFIKALKDNKTDMEMAKQFEVTEGVVFHLRDHFERFGIQSIVGRD